MNEFNGLKLKVKNRLNSFKSFKSNTCNSSSRIHSKSRFFAEQRHSAPIYTRTMKSHSRWGYSRQFLAQLMLMVD